MVDDLKISTNKNSPSPALARKEAIIRIKKTREVLALKKKKEEEEMLAADTKKKRKSLCANSRNSLLYRYSSPRMQLAARYSTPSNFPVQDLKNKSCPCRLYLTALLVVVGTGITTLLLLVGAAYIYYVDTTNIK
eukprot:CAMPEP_0171598302 /NCGR_PEP_ID=MMETSP0990-20121206/3049_1 /TAXON_ID=483369 /ORGANISM="non described non described, Strain CCMP2098" /LENGTH=134 /DNA_ID=CAMNT_0012159847 /DNA_START=62 /DNA_END=466 /DNA_ORIENTATION=-